MAEAGLIKAGTTGARDRRPYRITAAGRRAFADWIDREPMRSRSSSSSTCPGRAWPLPRVVAIAGHYFLVAVKRRLLSPAEPPAELRRTS
jgi:hypothetical protein